MLELLDMWLFHWSAEKAIWLGGRTLSWDARCAGIHVGIGVAVLYHILAGRKARHLPPRAVLCATAVLLLSLLIDVWSLQQGLRPPSNEWRFATGLAFGAGVAVSLYPAFVMLALSKTEPRAALATWGHFGGMLAALGAAFLVKALDNAAAYYVLEGLGLFGMLSLFILIVLGAVETARSLFNLGGEERWDKEQSAAQRRLP